MWLMIRLYCPSSEQAVRGFHVPLDIPKIYYLEGISALFRALGARYHICLRDLHCLLYFLSFHPQCRWHDIIFHNVLLFVCLF